MPTKAVVPWLLPLGLLSTVLVVALTSSVLLGILYMLAWVGVAFVYRAYARTREERRRGRADVT